MSKPVRRRGLVALAIAPPVAPAARLKRRHLPWLRQAKGDRPFKLFPSRVLVALGLAVAAVVSAAAPASASNTLWAPSPAWSASVYRTDGASGYINGYYDPANGYDLSEEVTAYKPESANDENLCTEVWVDWPTVYHHPADVYTNCRTDENYYGGILPIDWPRSDGVPAPGWPINTSYVTSREFRMAVCEIDVRTYERLTGPGGNCTEPGSGGPFDGGIGSIDNGDYQSMTLQGIQNAYTCCFKNGADLLPQYMNHGQIDIMGTETLHPGGLLVSWDGSHKLVMQHDGNLVLYNLYTGQATWAMSWYNGNHLVPGSTAVLQGGDGNFVVYAPNNGGPVWASGAYGGGGQWLQMQSDGNLVEHYSGGILWSTGTNGR